jgi:hypothetical protein
LFSERRLVQALARFSAINENPRQSAIGLPSSCPFVASRAVGWAKAGPFAVAFLIRGCFWFASPLLESWQH